MQCHRNMDSSQKPLGPEKLSTLCRSLQSPDPRGAQSICCSKRTDRLGHSWVQTVAQKNSRCPLTAFSSFPILYLMILRSRSGEFQWIPLQAADQGIQYRPQWLLEAWIPVFLRPASSSPCVFAIITENIQKGQEICFLMKESQARAEVSLIPPSPSRSHLQAAPCGGVRGTQCHPALSFPPIPISKRHEGLSWTLTS